MITKERLLEILDKSKPEDKVSFYTEIGLSSLILMNLLAVSLESVPSLSEKYSHSFLYFEIFSVIISAQVKSGRRPYIKFDIRSYPKLLKNTAMETYTFKTLVASS